MMKRELSKTDSERLINNYFSLDKLDRDKTRKIKRLAMKYNIELSGYRKRFCKKCLADLKNGKVRITKTHKIMGCQECGHISKIRIN